MAAFTIIRSMNSGNDHIRIVTECYSNNFTIRIRGNNSSIMKSSSNDEEFDQDEISYEILPHRIEIIITKRERENYYYLIIKEGLRAKRLLHRTYFNTEISEELFNDIHYKMEEITKDYPVKVAKSRGRNLVSLGEVGEGLGLPHNVEGHIGSFLSGKTGSADSQENQLRQLAGESLARRPGGGRRTRRRRRQ